MKTLKKLFMDGLAEIYDAESRLVWSMPQMVTAASCSLLQDAMAAHLLETEEHVTRLETIFDSLGEGARRKKSEATIALLHESHEIISDFKGFPVINAALIGAVQKIEHFEIASYGCLRDWAVVLGKKAAAADLQEILDEDKAANQTLTELARTRSNQEALGEHAAKPATTPGDPIAPGPTAADADMKMAGDQARFVTEAPTHECSRSGSAGRSAAGVLQRLRRLLNVTALWTNGRRTTHKGTSYEQQHRTVD